MAEKSTTGPLPTEFVFEANFDTFNSPRKQDQSFLLTEIAVGNIYTWALFRAGIHPAESRDLNACEES